MDPGRRRLATAPETPNPSTATSAAMLAMNLFIARFSPCERADACSSEPDSSADGYLALNQWSGRDTPRRQMPRQRNDRRPRPQVPLKRCRPGCVRRCPCGGITARGGGCGDRSAQRCRPRKRHAAVAVRIMPSRSDRPEYAIGVEAGAGRGALHNEGHRAIRERGSTARCRGGRPGGTRAHRRAWRDPTTTPRPYRAEVRLRARGNDQPAASERRRKAVLADRDVSGVEPDQLCPPQSGAIPRSATAPDRARHLSWPEGRGSYGPSDSASSGVVGRRRARYRHSMLASASRTSGRSTRGRQAEPRWSSTIAARRRATVDGASVSPRCRR